MEDKFDYVIAREWGPEYTGQLACYLIHSAEIQHGTMTSALDMLAYVQTQSPDKNWHIYRVIFDRVDV